MKKLFTNRLTKINCGYLSSNTIPRGSASGWFIIKTQKVNAPVKLPTAKVCLQFEYESFAALHQMLSGLSEEEKAATWQEIEDELSKFEDENGFSGPCEMVIGVGQKPME